MWRPLRALSLLPPSRGIRNLLLLSDGHIQNTELTLKLLRDNAQHSRLFTCGLRSEKGFEWENVCCPTAVVTSLHPLIMNMIITVTVGFHDFSELLFFQDYYTVYIFNELKKQEVAAQFCKLLPTAVYCRIKVCRAV